MDKTSLSDSTAQLFDAIRKLEAFTNQSAEAAQGSSLLRRMRSLFVGAFDSKGKPREKSSYTLDKNAVLGAIELIKSKRLLIQKLKHGTPAEQELAESLSKAIQTYNKCCDRQVFHAAQSPRGLKKFLSTENYAGQELPKIDIPEGASAAYYYSEHRLGDNAETPTPAGSGNDEASHSVPIPKQSAELFHMKVIALLERYGIASNPEARALVKQSPILTSLDAGDSKCTLKQTLTLFPGQTVVVMGTSALNPMTKAISELFPNTFFVSLESTQTAFPHPSQRAGWSLAHQLLPEYPQRLDLLADTAGLFPRKKQTMQELLPNGSLISKAKKLLRMKKQAFATCSRELLSLHKQLAETIFCASPHQENYHDGLDTISHFYDLLAAHHSPYEFISDAHQLVRDYFLAKPHQLLLDAIITGKATDLGSRDAAVRYQSAKSILQHAIDASFQEVSSLKNSANSLIEKAKWDYISLLGILIGSASIPIILQYLSEDLVFPPPTLTKFEGKIQAAAYNHLKDFLDELSSPIDHSDNTAYSIIKEQILSDIALFKNDEEAPLNNELAYYFQLRHNSLMQLS